MSTYDREQLAMDRMTDALSRALAMRTIGYFLIALAGITACFIWVGWRSGSNFWFYWSAAQGLVGMGLVGAGSYILSKMGSYLSRLDTEPLLRAEHGGDRAA